MEGAISLFLLDINPRKYSLKHAWQPICDQKKSISDRVNPAKKLTELMLKGGEGIKTDPENIF